MATNKELEKEIKELKAMVAKFTGTPVERDPDTKDPNYMAFGSVEHMGLLGLGLVEAGEEKDYITFVGKKGTYRLLDEVNSFLSYPDPTRVAQLVLRQKVGEFESGPPPIPENAPSLWEPIGY